MLTISKPLSAGQAQTYHQMEFTAKEQNYWSQRGVTAGEWQGRLAEQFGLAETVSAEDFAKLSQGQHPQTGEQLVRQRASYEYQDADGKRIKTMEHRAGWDATFSAPKSVSLTALVGGDERVREAHRESVRVALDQLEHYTQARIGGNHPPETTGRFIAAKFEHDTARPVDGYVAPQLHTHAVVFNLTERENGQPRAIQPHSLFASQQFATAIYQSELTYRLRQLGYEIAVGRSGAPEIKGYTQEYLDASSPRSQQIREYLERTGRAGKEAAEIAAHSTRDRKEIHSPHEVMAAHRKLAADFGYQADAVVRAARERSQHQAKPVNSFDRVRESLTFSRDKNFEREAVADQSTFIHNRLAPEGLVAGEGERFSNTVKRVDRFLLMLRPFPRCAYHGVGLVPKVCCQLPVRGHHLSGRMDLLAVPRRVRSDLGSFFSRAPGAFKVLTNLLAPGTGSVEIFLCVSLDLRSTAPPCRNFVTKLSEAVSQLGLIDRRGKLLGGEEALRLDCARLAIVAFRDIENERVSMQLWCHIPIDRTGCIVLKLGGYKFASGLGQMIAADAGLCVVFELVEGNADALPVGFTDTFIAADERG